MCTPSSAPDPDVQPANAPKSRYSVSRQSVCLPCARNKMKCDRQAPLCGRCKYLGRECTWAAKTAQARTSGRKRPRTNTPRDTPQAATLSESLSPVALPEEESDAVPSIGADENGGAERAGAAFGPVGLPFVPSLPDASASLESGFGDVFPLGGGLESWGRSGENAELDLGHLDLLCPIDGESIRARWLKPFLSDTVTKEYPPGVKKLITRMLTSYGTMAMRGDAPPFVHPALLCCAPMKPVRTALSLVRACAPPAVGGQVIAEAMESVVSLDPGTGLGPVPVPVPDADPVARLAALMAYLIYMLVLLHMGPEVHPQRQLGMANLERLASLASPNLLCEGERTLRSPRWEEWLVAESTRRALYTLYLLDNLLSMHDGFPTFLGNELTGLPLPSSGRLWSAHDRIAWQRGYNTFLARWGDGPPCIQELWPGGKEERMDRYLAECPDELGVFLFAVTCGTAVY